MTTRIAVLDANAEYRALLRHHISVDWPDAEVDDFDPRLQGLAADEFAGADYDVILLDLGSAGDDQTFESGLDWLQALVAKSRIPVVCLADGGDELTAVQALQKGAVDYVPKRLLKHQLVSGAIRYALDASRKAEERKERTGPSGSISGRSSLRIPGYRILRSIARNRQAAVYLARSEELLQKVVLKVFHRDSGDEEMEEEFERFAQECKVIARLNHRSIVDIYDYRQRDEYAFLAMEYFPCGDLKSRLQNPVSLDECIDYMQQLAQALGIIHDLGVLHRDLKPANVMLREDNTLVLIDFGLAKQMEGQEGLTEAGEIRGTPYYISPEQAQGDPVDERSDLYSLGVICFEMLTGRKPFLGDTSMAILNEHVHGQVPRLPGALNSMQPVIDGLMSKRPTARFQNVRELLTALDECSMAPV